MFLPDPGRAGSSRSNVDRCAKLLIPKRLSCLIVTGRIDTFEAAKK
jgi:hypothetical protein